MRTPLTLDDVEDLESGSGPAAERAGQLRRWAASAHPQDEVTTAELLVHAGEVLERDGDHVGALADFRDAVAAGGDVAPDARVYLHHALLATGARAEADELAAEVRRSRPADVNAYLLLGEDYEEVGDAATAHRWYALGLSRAEREVAPDDDPSAGAATALYTLGIARARVRRTLGFPPDADDLLALQQQRVLQEAWAAGGDGAALDDDEDAEDDDLP